MVLHLNSPQQLKIQMNQQLLNQISLTVPSSEVTQGIFLSIQMKPPFQLLKMCRKGERRSFLKNKAIPTTISGLLVIEVSLNFLFIHLIICHVFLNTVQGAILSL